MSLSVGKFDDLFLAMAQQCGKIEDILDVFFGFLQRKTDFFHIMTRNSESIGFPPHRAFQMLKNCFDKHQLIYLARVQPQLLQSRDEKTIITKPRKKLDQIKNEDEKSKSHEGKTRFTKQLQTASIGEPLSKSSIDNTHDFHESGDFIAEQNTKVNPKSLSSVTQSIQTGDPIPPSPCSATSSCPAVESRKRISTWNGGKCEKYWWNQSLTEAMLDIVLPEPHPIVKKELSVELQVKSLCIRLKDNVLLEGELYEPIELDGSMWTIEDQSRLVITLEKERENWWGNIVKGMDEIDLTKVESVKKLQDFDEDTQTAIRKVIWDKEREALGFKASEQLETEEILRKAWNAEGSPFKGHPFDPSLLNIGGRPFQPKSDMPK